MFQAEAALEEVEVFFPTLTPNPRPQPPQEESTYIASINSITITTPGPLLHPPSRLPPLPPMGRIK